MAINTHQGLYCFTKLPFGIASAPDLFQRAMDTIFQGIPHILCYIDDILITGSRGGGVCQPPRGSTQEVAASWCVAEASQVCIPTGLGAVPGTLSTGGVYTRRHKRWKQSSCMAATPKNKQKLRSFLGLVHYYGKVLTNVSTLLHLLNELLKAGKRWRWTPECERAFNAAKEKLSQAPVLAHYDPAVPLRLAGDASADGLGAVISHMYPDGTERPIAYASRTLTATEQNYAQLERKHCLWCLA